MSRILTDYGEEYLISNGFDSDTSTWDVGLYDDATDAIEDTDDLSAITTEPAGAAYARQSSTFSPSDEDGDATGLTEASVSDSDLVYDTSDSSQTVDSWFLVINFTATGDGTTSDDHLVATGALSDSRNLADVDELTLEFGGVGISVE